MHGALWCVVLFACGGPQNSVGEGEQDEVRAASGGARDRENAGRSRRRSAGDELEGEREGERERERPRAREEFVVLPDDAWVYTAPDERATKARVTTRTRGAWSAFALRVLESRPGWVAVEPLDAREERRHCAPTLAGIAALRVRLWVREASLAGVLTQRVRVDYEDRTSVMLRPGTRIEPVDSLSDQDRSVFTAYARGAVTNVPIGPESVGLRYTASDERWAAVTPDDPDALSFGARGPSAVESLVAAASPLRVGGIALLREPLGDGSEISPWNVTAEQPRGRRRRAAGEVPATLRTRCGVFVAMAPAAAVQPVVAMLTGAVVPPPVAAPEGGVRARPGAFLFWPDGRRAGRVREAVRFDMREGEDARGYPCVRQGLEPGYAPERDRRGLRALRVCLAPGDLEGR